MGAGRVLALRRRWRSSPGGDPRPTGGGRCRPTHRLRSARSGGWRPTAAGRRPGRPLRPRPGRASISAASLAARNGPVIVVPLTKRVVGQRSISPTRKRAHVRSPIAATPGRPDRSSTMASGSSSSFHVPQREDVGPFDHPGRFEAGHHQRGVAVAGQHQHGQPLEGHGLVPGQVRADRGPTDSSRTSTPWSVMARRARAMRSANMAVTVTPREPRPQSSPPARSPRSRTGNPPLTWVSKARARSGDEGGADQTSESVERNSGWSMIRNHEPSA